jgi:murein DD-endopeptidase MepM/ murein hydrolase activator NlpD
VEPRFGNPVRGKVGRLKHPDPDTGFVITRVYGDKSFPQFGDHDGLDLARGRHRGDPVIAMAGGTVTVAFTRESGAMIVRIDHGDGWSSGYGHLDSIVVNPREEVERGTQIGTLGNTGHTTGPHLHFDISRHGHRRDPWPLLEQNQVGGTMPIATRDAPPTEEEFMPLPLRERFEHVTVPKGTRFFTDGPGVGPEKKFTIEVKLQSVAISVDGKWRLIRFQNAAKAPRELLYIRSRSIKPKAANGEPTYDAKVVAAIKA